MGIRGFRQKNKSHQKAKKSVGESHSDTNSLSPAFHPTMLNEPLTPTSVIALQRMYGNRFVAQLRHQQNISRETATQSQTFLHDTPKNIRRCAACGGSTEEGECAACKQKRLARKPESDTIQLKGEDIGHNLTASDFTGQTTLESCFDGKATLRQGSPDSGAVKAVQNALIKLGFGMPSGADGIYGGETVNAVSQFQIKSGMSGGDVDGIIGKKTMGLLDAATRDGAMPQEDDKKSDDLKVIGKYQDSAEDPMSLYFDLAQSSLDGQETAKLEKIAKQFPNTKLILKGTASEEGAPEFNAQLAQQRIDSVSGKLIEVGQIDAKDKDTLHVSEASPQSGKGDLNYRKLRAVKVLLKPESPDPEDGACATKEKPEETEKRKQAFEKAVPQAVQMLENAKNKLPPTGDAIPVFDSLFGTNDTTRAATVTRVVDIMNGMIDHIGKMTQADRHKYADNCDGICKTGSPAYNSDGGDDNPSGTLTMCPSFVGHEEGEAIILVHEGHHGTPKIESSDFAYPTRRLITQLDTETALKNAASFHLFVNWVADPSGTQIGPKDKDKQGNLSDEEKKKIDLPVAWLEQWLIMAKFDLSTLYSAIRDSQGCTKSECQWKNKSHANAMMEDIAPRFNLTPAHLQPKQSDQEAAAALYDRILQMSDTMKGALTFDKVATGQTQWETGPGQKVTLSQDFFNLKPSQMIVALMQELVHATDNISASAEPEYVAIIDSLRTIRKLGGPTP